MRNFYEPWDEPWDTGKSQPGEIPESSTSVFSDRGFSAGGGVWIGFEILDLVGLRVDCMSMVASHGQCHASSSILRAGPSSGRKKKILFNSVVCVCHFLTSVSSSFN